MRTRGTIILYVCVCVCVYVCVCEGLKADKWSIEVFETSAIRRKGRQEEKYYQTTSCLLFNGQEIK